MATGVAVVDRHDRLVTWYRAFGMFDLVKMLGMTQNEQLTGDWRPMAQPTGGGNAWPGTGDHYSRSFGWIDFDLTINLDVHAGEPTLTFASRDYTRPIATVDPRRWFETRDCHFEWKDHGLVLDEVAFDPESRLMAIAFAELPGYPPIPCDPSALAHVFEVPAP